MAAEPLLADMDGRSQVVVAFGGFHHGLGMPLFEFSHLLTEFDADKVFVRDFAQRWYHAGIPGHDSISRLTEHLRSILDTHQRVIAVGNSMGGYAALLFGALCEASCAIAFSPQTDLSKSWRQGVGDDRWQDRLEATAALSQIREDYVDPREVLV